MIGVVHINVLSLSVCAVTGVILALVLKSTGSSMGTFVSVVLCVGTAMLVFNGLISVYTRINMFTAGINQEYIKADSQSYRYIVCNRNIIKYM